MPQAGCCTSPAHSGVKASPSRTGQQHLQTHAPLGPTPARSGRPRYAQTRGQTAARPIQQHSRRSRPVRQADGPQRPAMDARTANCCSTAPARRRTRSSTPCAPSRPAACSAIASSFPPCASAATKSTGIGRWRLSRCPSRQADRAGRRAAGLPHRLRHERPARRRPETGTGLSPRLPRVAQALEKPIELWPRHPPATAADRDDSAVPSGGQRADDGATSASCSTPFSCRGQRPLPRRFAQQLVTLAARRDAGQWLDALKPSDLSRSRQRAARTGDDAAAAPQGIENAGFADLQPHRQAHFRSDLLEDHRGPGGGPIPQQEQRRLRARPGDAAHAAVSRPATRRPGRLSAGLLPQAHRGGESRRALAGELPFRWPTDFDLFVDGRLADEPGTRRPSATCSR